MSEVFPLRPIQSVPSVHFGKDNKGKPFIYLNSAFVKQALSQGMEYMVALVDGETGRFAIQSANTEHDRVQAGTLYYGDEIYSAIVEQIAVPESDYVLTWDEENQYFYCVIKEPTPEPEPEPDNGGNG